MKDLEVNPNARLQNLRNRCWFSDHVVVAPLWRDLQDASPLAFGRLLNLGCGNAPYRDGFAGHVRDYITADHPPISPGVQVVCDLQRLPFSNGSFDTVLYTQVLEHIPRPWQATGEITWFLKPGGILSLSGPQYWVLHEIPHDYFRFTPYGLRVLFPEIAWNSILHQQQGSTWAGIASALWHLFESLGRSRKLLSFLLNPLFLALNGFWRTPRYTTNHLIVLRRKPDPINPGSSRNATVS